MRNSVLILCLLAAVSLATPPVSLAHPGRTDAKGGHHDRKNGGYHYHNSGRSSTTPNANRPPVQNTHAQKEYVVFVGQVVGVTDGDTIRVMRNGEAVKVRLYGIDCPEKNQAFGSRAKQFTSELCFSKEVAVRVMDTDRYGRIIGDVALPSRRNLNREIVKAGFAWWYEEYAPDDKVLKQFQTNARLAKLGLWVDPSPIPPWDFRRRK